MSRASATTPAGPVAAYLALIDAAPGPVAPELAGLRREARDRFAALGFPHAKLEAWRETSLAPVFGHAFDHPAPVDLDAARAALAASPQANLGLPRLVVVNGRIEPALSDALTLPEGCFAGSLGDPKLAHAGGANGASGVGSIGPWREQAFAALSSALSIDVAAIAIAPRVAVAGAIHLVHLTMAGREATVVAPRCLVSVGRDAKVHVVESFIGVGERAYLSLPVTEIDVALGAHVTHTRVQVEQAQGFHMGYVAGRCARSAHFASRSVSLGGALARVEIDVALMGEGAHAELLGLYMPRGKQHLDNRTRLDHAVPHCTSSEIYKGILTEDGTAVFNGYIIVRQDAQKTDARQQNDNLLLSRDALVQTRPQLEIYADDVKCAHGATIGRLDDDALFYLRSRGVPANEARGMLTRAFAHEVLDKLDVPELSARVDAEIDARLAQ